MKGKLFVISGPSGVGKGTLREHALKDIPALVYSISCTTRQPRTGETDGVEYRFMTHEKFESGISQGLFLEYANVHGQFYGTLKSDVETQLELGNSVLLEIDVQGALQVREKMQNAILIFIAPPSIQELEKRLVNRHTEASDVIQLRLKNAVSELALKDKYDYIIINSDLNTASKELKNIFKNEISK